MRRDTEKLFTLDTETARAIAARRKAKIRACAICGREFTTVGRGLYDRPACREIAYRRRKKERSDEAK